MGNEYSERINVVEHGSFTPLVFSTCDGMGHEATVAIKRLATTLAFKRNESRNRCHLPFSLARSAICCVRGSRFIKCKALQHGLAPVDLVCAKANMQVSWTASFYTWFFLPFNPFILCSDLLCNIYESCLSFVQKVLNAIIATKKYKWEISCMRPYLSFPNSVLYETMQIAHHIPTVQCLNAHQSLFLGDSKWLGSYNTLKEEDLSFSTINSNTSNKSNIHLFITSQQCRHRVN